MDWSDFDHAMAALAVSIGIMSPDEDFTGRAKHVFWSANPVGDALGRCLDELVEAGILLKEEGTPRFRWNPSFAGNWES